MASLAMRTQPLDTSCPRSPRVISTVEGDLTVAAAELLQHVRVAGNPQRPSTIDTFRADQRVRLSVLEREGQPTFYNIRDLERTRPMPTPRSRATAATAWASLPTRRQASARARSVSTARGRTAAARSVQVRTPQAGSRQRQMRLHHNSTTGRPPAGRSRTRTVRGRGARPGPRSRCSRPRRPWSGRRPATRRRRCPRRGPRSRPGRAAWRLRHYCVGPPGASFLQTSDIRKLCEVPGAVLAAPTSPSATHHPALHDDEPCWRAASPRRRDLR
jgi:hypothetical protein